MASTTIHETRILDGRKVDFAATVTVDGPTETPTPDHDAPDLIRITSGESEDLPLPEEPVFAWIGQGDGSRMIRLYAANTGNARFEAAVRQCIRDDGDQFGQLLGEAVTDPDRLRQLLDAAAPYQSISPEDLDVSFDLRLSKNGATRSNYSSNGSAATGVEPLRIAIDDPGEQYQPE